MTSLKWRIYWGLDSGAMKTVILNNSVIALSSTKEYSLENLEYFRLRSSPKKMKKKKTKMGDFKVRSFANDTRSLAFKANL